MIKVLKNIVTYITVFIAIGYFIYITFVNQCDTYEYMILSLLILIATTFVLEQMDDTRKWKEIENSLKTQIVSITDCRILTFDNTKDWVDKIIELTKEGTHSFDSAALDKTTRSKAKDQYSSIWGYLEYCSKEKRIQFRHILRVRKNNLYNLLKRMNAGGAKKNSYFAYYELVNTFSFPTFGVIDNRYIVTRSPYEQGEIPCYLIIDNTEISKFFVSYFNDLWRESIKVDRIAIVEELYSKYEEEYTAEEKTELLFQIEQLGREKIIDDI